MKEEIERLARQPSEDELFDEIERFVARTGVDADRAALLAELDADRR